MKYNLILAVIFWILSLGWIIFIIYKKWAYLKEDFATLPKEDFNKELKISNTKNIFYNFLHKTLLRLHLFTLKSSNKTGSWLEKIRTNHHKTRSGQALNNDYWHKLKEK